MNQYTLRYQRRSDGGIFSIPLSAKTDAQAKRIARDFDKSDTYQWVKLFDASGDVLLHYQRQGPMRGME